MYSTHARISHTNPQPGQGHAQLGQLAQRPALPDLEGFQGKGIYPISWQPAVVFEMKH